MRKLATLSISFVLAFSGLIMLPYISTNVLGGTDHYWIGTTTVSNLNTNWLPATVPSNGDNIYFSALSVGQCFWTLTDSYGSYNLLANFTSTITQGSAFSITSYSQQAGTFIGGAYI